MLPPVTGRAPLVPDHAAQHVERGVRAHQRVTPIPVDLDADGVARMSGAAPSTVCQTVSPSLRTSVTRGLTERAGVEGLATARGVQDRAVEGDAVALDGHDGRLGRSVR